MPGNIRGSAFQRKIASIIFFGVTAIATSPNSRGIPNMSYSVAAVVRIDGSPEIAHELIKSGRSETALNVNKAPQSCPQISIGPCAAY